MTSHIIPADVTIAALEKKADDLEQRAAVDQDPLATELREEANSVRSGSVIAFRPLDKLMIDEKSSICGAISESCAAAQA